jgi:AAA+ superfamily predicted ATPase
MLDLRVEDYIRAGYPFLWVKTYEENRFVNYILSKFGKEKVFLWDIINGMQKNLGSSDPDGVEMADALAPFDYLTSICKGGDIIIYLDAHQYTGSNEWQRKLKSIESICKQDNKHIIFVDSTSEIPRELEITITLVDFPLPKIDEIEGVAKLIIESLKGADFNKGKYEEKDVEYLTNQLPNCKYALGLPLPTAENAISLALSMNYKIDKDIIEHEKLYAIRKSGAIEIINPVPEEDLGGHEGLKKYIKDRKKAFEDTSLPRPQGIVIVGPPGTGKSLSAKVIASVLKLLLVRINLGAVKGPKMGETEKLTRETLALIEAVSPCVVWFDEFEKQIGGAQSSDQTDGGTVSNMVGTTLTWMQESKDMHYIVATVNDIDEILAISQGAFLRRFDDVYFLDLPTLGERKIILNIMNKRYKTNISESYTEEMDHWSGSEIEHFVKSSVFEGIELAFRNTKTIYNQNKPNIDRVREWAKKNARLANTEDQVLDKKPVRKLNIISRGKETN